MKKLEKMLKKYGKDAKVEMTFDDLFEFANYIIKEVKEEFDDGSKKSKLLSMKELIRMFYMIILYRILKKNLMRN